ncbi:MAG TPA: lipase [Verrucomicrobiales bacterium]|nr:lipase [Verrucomicrobiales bacterium]HRJ08702.1 alpha/beta hydrolase [Prosthecobacter sp.]HRK14025.1 alpha/beta hydrolase [Prosthecobacter sp.]
MITHRFPLVLGLVFLVSLPAAAQQKARKETAKGPPPTFADVPYGTDERQVLDFYQAKSGQPAPLVLFIHGGGWRGGDKDRAAGYGLNEYLEAGLSVAAINYRFVPAAHEAGIKPPVKWPLEDAARALQFVRSKAGEWRIDKTRIGATGSSAGAASSLWLLFHDDMADAGASDPVARESTRLTCAGVLHAQTCFDPHLLRAWMPNMTYGGHAFGFIKDGQTRKDEFQAFHDGREQIMPWVKQYSPYHLVTADDPPVLLQYDARADEPPVVGKRAGDAPHSAVMGIKLLEKLRETGVEGHLVYPGGPESSYPSAAAFLIARLMAK